jgi:hypothetical protein
MPSQPLRIGGRDVSRSDANAYATRYLTEGNGWAYPSYDGFQRETATGPLLDGDLLAPVLLNVSYLSIRTYEALKERVGELQAVLDDIPVDLDLVDAEERDLALLGHLFAVLDRKKIAGAQGTVLAKLLHRKRPRFIPLYDERVRGVYQDGEGAPIPVQPGRSWEEFMRLFGAAVQEDLHREVDFYSELASLATDPPVTPLRTLDIVAWWAGGTRVT